MGLENPFPLTPALSPGERENCRQLASESGAMEKFYTGQRSQRRLFFWKAGCSLKRMCCAGRRRDFFSTSARTGARLNRWRKGANFDTLAKLYHDATEERAILTPFPQAQLPVEYQTAMKGHKPGDILDPFKIQDKQRDIPKYFVVEIVSMEPERDPSSADFHDKIREQLAQEKAIRRYLDILRRQTFVVVRI